MIKKHPKDRAERLRLKKLHTNASPVFKLLAEKEELDAQSKRNRVLPQRGDTEGPSSGIPQQGNTD